MNGDPVFVDTNVLVCLRDSRDPRRQRRAAEWMGHLWESRLGRTSVQVLHEYYVTVTDKLDPGLSREEARDDIMALASWSPYPLESPITEETWEIQDRWGFSFWDSLIVAAARAQRCGTLLTEDLSHGQELEGLRVVSPFLETPWQP